jgi:hypothetical protein
MRWLVGLLVVTLPSLAHADDGENWLIGPVLGVRLGGPPGERLVIGAEGGVGFGPERINFGFTHSNSDIVYVELDPWYVVGGSLGLAVNTDNGAASPVLGLWEGIPLNDGPCSEWHPQLTLAGGYRYTGRHELYVTLKAGRMDGSVCFGD